MKLSRKTAIAIKGLVNPPRRIGASLIARPGITSQSGGAIPVKIASTTSNVHTYNVYTGTISGGSITWSTSTRTAYCVGYWRFGADDITTAVDGPSGLLLDAPDNHAFCYGHFATALTVGGGGAVPDFIRGAYSPEQGFLADSSISGVTYYGFPSWMQSWYIAAYKNGPTLTGKGFKDGTVIDTSFVFRVIKSGTYAGYIAEAPMVSYSRAESGGTPYGRDEYHFTHFWIASPWTEIT